jgi:hypothetical protein
MTYTVIYNGKYGKDSILINPNATKIINVKNEFYGYFHITILEPEHKLVSCIPKEMDRKSKSIRFEDFESYLNQIYSDREDDFDIIHDLLSKVLVREIIKENITLESISL